MKIIIWAILIIMAFVFLYSCGNSSEPHPRFDGIFITENGTSFELRADSTTLIKFSDSVTYKGTWTVRADAEETEFVNIEFGGYKEYFYLKDGKLYRSEREMRHSAFGTKVKYQD